MIKLASSINQIVVEMPISLDNAGSTLIAYELQADNGLQGAFTEVYRGLNRTVALQTVVGRTYRFRHRVMNSVGWSEFSQTKYILAADAPSKPCSKPLLVSVDSNSITINLLECSASNNGALITSFVLFIQSGFTG